jgi:hypothetical protein
MNDRIVSRPLVVMMLAAIALLVVTVFFVFLCSARAMAAEKPELCTWDISYYLLGEHHRSVPAHAWLLTAEQQAQLFGPFIAGHVFVEPGKAVYVCAGKTVHITTTPLPSGSLLLLREK